MNKVAVRPSPFVNGKEAYVIENTEQVKPTNQKVYFIRVSEEEYKRIANLALSEERSINKMANLLIKQALESRK